MVEQLERIVQNPSKAVEIENTSFSKAKTKEEYVTMMKSFLQQVHGSKKEALANMQQPNQSHGNVQDTMMTMQNLTNRGQGIAPGNQQIQMQQSGMQGNQPNIPGQQINIQQNQLNMIRQQQLQQQQQQLQQQQQQQLLHSKLQMSQQPTAGGMQQNMGFNPTINQAQMIRTQTNFVSPTGQPPQNPMARGPAPVTGVYPGQPTPPQHQPGMVPSPAFAQQMSPAGPQPGSQPVLSPATYMQPSPSPQQAQSMPSPVSNIHRASVPSPSTSLNTPGNPSSVGSAPSPSSAGRGPGSVGSHPSQEEQALIREKQKMLMNYVENLKKQIAALKEQGDITKVTKRVQIAQYISEVCKSNDLNKLTQLHQQFIKTSVVGLGAQSSSSVLTSGTTTQTTSSTKSNQIFQPLLNAISEQINSPSLNHNLQKAFGPALNTLHGMPSSFTAPVLKKPSPDVTLSQGVPDIVQGEVARLPPKFKVTLDPAHLPDSDSVHLLCKLEDDHLPSVPPVCVVIPEQYPSVNPQYDANAFYCQTQFHQLVHKMLLTQLSHMPDLYTFTQLMDAWEMSVRRSCHVI